MRNFVARLGIVDTIEKPLHVYCDNAASVFFAKNNKRTSAFKNIEVKYFSVRESVRDKEVEIIKTVTMDQLADPLTKALPVGNFQDHIKNMGIVEKF